jgi:hypothetical protein
MVGDLADPPVQDEAARDVSLIFNLAGETRDAVAMGAVNVSAVRGLLQQARRHGVRQFLHLSSVGVMGSNHRGRLTRALPAGLITLMRRASSLARGSFWRLQGPTPCASSRSGRPPYSEREQARSATASCAGSWLSSRATSSASTNRRRPTTSMCAGRHRRHASPCNHGGPAVGRLHRRRAGSDR